MVSSTNNRLQEIMREFEDDDDDDDDESVEESGLVVDARGRPAAGVLQVPLGLHDDDDDDGNQLPSLEEYRTSAAFMSSSSTESRLSRQRRRRYYTIWGGIFAGFLLVVILGVTLSRNSSPPQDMRTTAAPVAAPPSFASGSSLGPPGSSTTSMRVQAINKVLLAQSVTSWDDLTRQGSPQQLAVEWLAVGDGRSIFVSASTELLERYALAVLYYALQGDDWFYRRQTHWMSATWHCHWKAKVEDDEFGGDDTIGVDCFGGDSVRSLFLPRNGLKGSLPSEISALSTLEHLNLEQNELTGYLPPQLGELQTLRNLILNENHLNGELPQFLDNKLPALKHLDLSRNQLVGGIPLTGLSHLETLNIGYNILYDDVAKLMRLTSIQNLIAPNNDFTGHLNATVLQAWPDLEILDLSGCLLEGSLPTNLLQMPKLRVIDLSDNKLNGSFPTESASAVSPLQFLALQHNNLSGGLTGVAGNLPTSLRHLDLSNNSFTGNVPEFTELVNLHYLFLADNSQLEAGPIPESLTALPNLMDVSLQSTNRNGKIPTGFGKLPELTLLDLSDNDLTGPLPTDLASAAKLRFLFCNGNSLTGQLPAFPDSLHTLLLERNDISGATSSVCSSLPKLEFFSADCSEYDSCPSDCCSLCCLDGSQKPVDNTDSSSSNGSSSPAPTPAPNNFPQPTINEFTDDEFLDDRRRRRQRKLQDDNAPSTTQQHTCNDQFTFNGQLNPQFETEYKRVQYKFNSQVAAAPADMPADVDFVQAGDDAYYWPDAAPEGITTGGDGAAADDEAEDEMDTLDTWP